MKNILFCIVLFASLSIFSQHKISKQQAIEDLNYFNATLTEVHYNPFLFISKENYFKKVDELKRSLKDSIALKAFILKLSQLTAHLEDSHTSPALVQPSLASELKKNNFFPYILVRDQQKLYLPVSTAKQLNIRAGAELVSINGSNLEALLKEFDQCYGGTANFSSEVVSRLLPYLLLLKDIVPPYQLVYKDSTGKQNSITIQEGVTFKNALSATIPSFQKRYDFKILENKLGLLNFTSMSGDLHVFDLYVDSCITLLKKNKVHALAIDVRDNSGGNSQFADLLISYFNTKYYSLMGQRHWKISRKYKDYLKAYGDTTHEYLSKTNGSIWELGECKPEKPTFDNNNVFDGNIYLITGPFTFSSANMFADGVKHYKLAQIVGTPTGENTNDFGEVYSFELPNSKIKMNTTTSYDYGVDCNKKKFEPVQPDVLIQTPLIYKIREEDFVIKTLLEQVK